jgi:hypothetical protein
VRKKSRQRAKRRGEIARVAEGLNQDWLVLIVITVGRVEFNAPIGNRLEHSTRHNCYLK